MEKWKVLSLKDSSVANIHLQWFAAEDEGRTEDPTTYKIRKAREDGRVAKSADLVGAVTLILSLILIALISGYLVSVLIEMMSYFISHSVELDIFEGREIYFAFLSFFFRLTFPIMLIAFLGAFIGNLLQVGFIFATKPLQPDFQKIVPNIGRWLQRSLFSVEGIFNVFKSIFKVVVITIISVLNIRYVLPQFVAMNTLTVLQNFKMMGITAFKIMIEAAVFLLVLAIPDYIVQRRQYRESLKMTLYEVKQEFKEHEGDPMVKQHIQRTFNEIISSNMIQNVPKADVVITNPTHYAIALEYDQTRMDYPIVTAKGVDVVAQRIKAIAFENNVPVVENRPLARSLYANVEIGDEIPVEYIEAVALILGEIYRLNGKYGPV